MADRVNRRVLLASRPDGAPTADNFRLAESPVPEPGDGEALYRTIYISLDPYMRGRMNDGESYAEPVAIDGVMGGGSVGRVVASNASHAADLRRTQQRGAARSAVHHHVGRGPACRNHFSGVQCHRRASPRSHLCEDRA